MSDQLIVRGKVYTPVIKREGTLYWGHPREHPYANAVGETKEELLANMKSALDELLELGNGECPVTT